MLDISSRNSGRSFVGTTRDRRDIRFVVISLVFEKQLPMAEAPTSGPDIDFEVIFVFLNMIIII